VKKSPSTSKFNSCDAVDQFCLLYRFDRNAFSNCLVVHGTYLSTFATQNYRKDLKKVTKLEAQIPYHEGRGNKDEVVKIKEQIADIWEKAKAAALE
jgi:hypothetical protein